MYPSYDQDSQNRTARTGQAEQDSQYNGIGRPGQDRQDRTLEQNRENCEKSGETVPLTLPFCSPCSKCFPLSVRQYSPPLSLYSRRDKWYFFLRRIYVHICSSKIFYLIFGKCYNFYTLHITLYNPMCAIL